jgi:hypothetical protein
MYLLSVFWRIYPEKAAFYDSSFFLCLTSGLDGPPMLVVAVAEERELHHTERAKG